MFDRDKLAKVMGLATSDHDGEALSALRKANAMVKEAKLTWAEVLTLDRPARARVIFESNPGSDPPSWWTAQTENRDATTHEQREVALARVRLEAVLTRHDLAPAKRSHFEAIRSRHQSSGYINPTHRAQIDRHFFTAGWDKPLQGGASALTDEDLNKTVRLGDDGALDDDDAGETPWPTKQK